MQKLVEIPKLFYSDLSSSPFEKCDVCKAKLEEDSYYKVEKAFKAYEENSGISTLFEIAICSSCIKDLKSTLSSESLDLIEFTFAEALENERPEREEYQHELDLNFWINRCIITDIPKHLLSEYQLVANFKGDKMIVDASPYMVSMEAIESVYESISEESKEVLEVFSEENIKVSSELKSFFTNGFPKLII